MNVKNLIDKLKTYPQDASVVVLYTACSDYCILEDDALTFIPSPGDVKKWDSAQYVLRNGMVMRYDVKTWPKEEVPQFLSLLVFPGN